MLLASPALDSGLHSFVAMSWRNATRSSLTRPCPVLRQTIRIGAQARSFNNASSVLGNPPASTVNASEIAHFSRLSAQWWDERGEFALLHKMNPHRMQFVREKLLEVVRDEDEESLRGRGNGERVMEGLDVLDVGCGGGILSEVRSVPKDNIRGFKLSGRAWHVWARTHLP